MNNTASKLLKVSTIFGLALASVAAYAEKKIVIDGSTTVGPIAKAFSDFYKEGHSDVNISISESGSGNGAKSLMNGACDIANMSRFMKPAEFKSCAEKGVMPVAHVVAYDGIAIIVNPANKVGTLTLEQVEGIYTGKITNWKEVGGDDAKIVVVSRDTNSGTYETFNELVLEKKPVVKEAEYVGSNGQARTRVNTTANAVAYVGLGFIDDTVKPVSINGVLPNAKTVATGKYAVSRPLFMFTNGFPKLGGDVFNFVTLCLTKEGREIIKDLGFIPVVE